MASLKPLKSFAHNLADHYLSTMGWIEDDYNSTWLYRAALESNAKNIELDILNKKVVPSDIQNNKVLLKSIDDLDGHFFNMLSTQKIDIQEVASLIFYFEFPLLSEKTVLFVCKPVAIDRSGKEHHGAQVNVEYGYEILAKL